MDTNRAHSIPRTAATACRRLYRFPPHEEEEGKQKVLLLALGFVSFLSSEEIGCQFEDSRDRPADAERVHAGESSEQAGLRTFQSFGFRSVMGAGEMASHLTEQAGD